jgi:hypothetical protein
LAGGGGVAKASAISLEGASMIGIGAIALFIIIFGALNFFEFGRLD